MCILRCHIKCIYHGYPQVLKDICRICHYGYSIYSIYDNIEYSYRHFEDNFRKSIISMSYTLYANGREFKETTYPDDSLEFHTRSHIPYNLNINQGCDILEQDIPDVVISQVCTKHIHKTRKYIHGIE